MKPDADRRTLRLKFDAGFALMDQGIGNLLLNACLVPHGAKPNLLPTEEKKR
ncbi:MAG: hypothetical protein ABIZ04_08065 [Opitutus sp.]